MKFVKNKVTGSNYSFKESKDYLKRRKYCEKFHITISPVVKNIVKLFHSQRWGDRELGLFFHYIMNGLNKDSFEEMNFYENRKRVIFQQNLINEVYYQVKYDFPSLTVPRSMDHLKKLKGGIK